MAFVDLPWKHMQIKHGAFRNKGEVLFLLNCPFKLPSKCIQQLEYQLLVKAPFIGVRPWNRSTERRKETGRIKKKNPQVFIAFKYNQATCYQTCRTYLCQWASAQPTCRRSRTSHAPSQPYCCGGDNLWTWLAPADSSFIIIYELIFQPKARGHLCRAALKLDPLH